jgi:hypothetical protein
MNVVTVRAFRDELTKIAAAGGLAGLSAKALGVLKSNPMAVSAALGAATFVAAQYAANRAPKDGGKSGQQRLFSRIQASSEHDEKQRKKEGKKPTFVSESRRILAKPMSQLATLSTKHPLPAALPAAAVGAKVGVEFAKLLF